MTVASRRDRLSVVIPTKNAAALLKDCLASVAWADEIIVVDMFSTDGTADICARYPQCHVFRRQDYIEGNANFGFEQATGDWVMRLDSDERIPPELAEELQQILANPPDGITGFEFWERVIILGRELRHGFGRKHYRRMMFRRSRARYPAQAEHQQLNGDGAWRRTRHGHLHYNYTSVAQYLTKTNYYTENDVQRATLPARPPGFRQVIGGTARPLYLYYLKWQGFRDGWVGLVDAGMRAFYQFTYWAKLRERWEREHQVADAP